MTIVSAAVIRLPARRVLLGGMVPAPRNGDGDVGGRCDLVISRHLRDMELRGRAGSTVCARRWLLLRLQDTLGCPLTQASAGQLAGWREQLLVDRDTVRTYVSHVRQFYAWLRRCGLRADDPSLDLLVPPRRRRLPRPIGEQDLLAAVAGAPGRIRPWLVLAAWAGLRAKEIALLRRENVLEHAQPPGLFVATDATKGHDERFIPMVPAVRDALLEHGLPQSGWVFPRGDGLPGPNRPHTISHLANRYLHGAGIKDTLHQLRHRFGTQFQAACGDLRKTQQVMGHRDPQSTSGYTLVTDADIADIITRIPGAVRPGQLKAVNQ